MAKLSRTQGYALFGGTKRSAGKGKATSAKKRRETYSQAVARRERERIPDIF